MAPADEQHVEMPPGVRVVRRNSGSLVHCRLVQFFRPGYLVPGGKDVIHECVDFETQGGLVIRFTAVYGCVPQICLSHCHNSTPIHEKI